MKNHTAPDESDDSPDGEVEPLDAEETPETEAITVAEAEIQRVVQRVLAWAAPLPSPEWLDEYRQVKPETVDIILEDFAARARRESEAAEHQRDIDRRQMALYEREQGLRERVSGADIETRSEVLRFGRWFLALLVVLGFTILMFGPFDSDWGRVAAAALFLTPIALLCAIVLVRGRVSKEERDIFRHLLPKLIDRSAHPLSDERPSSSQRTLQTGDAADDG